MDWYTIFPQVLNVSLTASVVIGFVLIVRVLLRKTPKIFSYALWAVVLFRLLCPVSITADFSLLGLLDTPLAEATGFPSSVEYVPANIVHMENPQVEIPLVGDAINERLPQGEEQLAADPLEAPISIATWFWMLGILAMAFYSIGNYIRLRRRLVGASLLKDNIYLADHISSPFVMGLFQPKIYLPSSLSEQEQEYIIAHEQHHIRRLDHVIIALSFLALCIHWFNPLVWVAFVLSGKDMEMSCDEAVVKKLGTEIRADYSASLLNLATGHRWIPGAPLAFGEGDTKGRIRNLSRWKKPALWLSMIAAVLVIVITVALITNPAGARTTVMGSNYSIKEVLYAVTVGDEVSTAPPLQYCVTADYHLYYQQELEATWVYLGKLEPYTLTNSELSQYMPVDLVWYDPLAIHQITDSYFLRVENDNFYLVFQTKNGNTYLAYGWQDMSERYDAASDDTRLRRLYLLQSELHEGLFQADFFARSLAHCVDNNVDPFCYWSHNDFPGYVIVGFMSDGTNQNDMTDMGFAVFHTNDGSGYELVNCHVYDNAALVENGIYFCEHPAVLSTDRICTDENSFDVILSTNEDLEKIVRVYHYEDRADRTFTEYTTDRLNMALFGWADSEGSDTISQYYYDSDGNVIADYGIGPTESTQPAMESGIPSAKNENWSFSEWNFSNVTMIQITNLHNGRYSFITEPEDLTKIISFMQDVSGTNAESARGYYEGTYSLKFYSGDTLVYSMGFGDSPSFFCGDYGDGYPCRYELVELTISEVVAFLSPFDTSGFAWEIV